MRADDPVHVRGWSAELALGFERRGARTVLAHRRHDGPLVVQKPLHPEGEAVCHAIVVHPPAGIAGGDDLLLEATAGAGSHALLTTPGAAKWYRTAGAWARSRVRLRAAPGAHLEWLPQETIVFDGARAAIELDVELEGDAAFVGWDITCLGRTGSGERFASGEIALRTAIRRDGRPVWIERGRLAPPGGLLDSPAGLAGESVTGTLVAAAREIDDRLLAACRAVAPRAGRGAVTRLPGLLVARQLGGGVEAARRYFTALWAVLRPALAGREAAEPRIWRT